MQLQEITRQVEDTLRQANIKPWTAIFSLGLIVVLPFSLPSMSRYKSQMDAVRDEVSADASKTDKLERELEFEKAQAAIANERYKQCLPVVGEEYRNGTHYFTSLTEGQQIFDRITKLPLAQGTVICDANGMSAVVAEEGKVSALAYTGDRNAVQERLKRFKASQYSQPIIKEIR